MGHIINNDGIFWTVCVNFTELRQNVCKLYKLSTNVLTVPRRSRMNTRELAAP